MDHGLPAAGAGDGLVAYGAPLPPPPLPAEQTAFGFDMMAAAAAGPLPAPSLADFGEPAVAAAPLPRPPRGGQAFAHVLIPLCKRGEGAAIERHLAADTACVEEVDDEGNTPLHVSVEAPRNEVATVQILLQYGANVNAANCLGATPLHYVCLRKSNWRGIANILLENGAAIDAQTLAGKTALHFACEQQVPELVEVLCLFGANANLVDSEGNGAIHLALAKPGRDTVKHSLLEHVLGTQATVLSPNAAGHVPIHLACRGGYLRCLQYLLDSKADLSVLSARRESCLHFAVSAGHAEVTQFLTDAARHLVDHVDEDNNTPLHVCAYTGNHDCAIVLLRNGAKAGLRNREGKTPLEVSKIRGTDLSSTHSLELEHLLRDAQPGGGCRQS